MKQVIGNAMAIQRILGKGSKAAPIPDERLLVLRARIPESFLDGFDSFVRRQQ
jgi:hypothetical protein